MKIFSNFDRETLIMLVVLGILIALVLLAEFVAPTNYMPPGGVG